MARKRQRKTKSVQETLEGVKKLLMRISNLFLDIKLVYWACPREQRPRSFLLWAEKEGGPEIQFHRAEVAKWLWFACKSAVWLLGEEEKSDIETVLQDCFKEAKRMLSEEDKPENQ